MILDHLTSAPSYRNLAEGLAQALDFLNSPGAAALEPHQPGPENSLRVDLKGDEIFALVQRYHTKSSDQAFWEAHRKYIDVQCLIEGSECMAWLPLSKMRITQPYDPQRDFMKLEPMSSELQPQMLRVCAGMFAVFMPHDAHMPGLAVNSVACPVKKIVVKVAV